MYSRQTGFKARSFVLAAAAAAMTTAAAAAMAAATSESDTAVEGRGHPGGRARRELEV